MLPAIFLLAAIIVLRLAPWLGGQDAVQNFSGYTPLMAYALCGGVFLPRKIALWFPLLAVAVTHGIINRLSGFDFIDRRGIAAVFVVVAVSAAGIVVKKKASAPVLFGTCLASTVLFYLVSNTVSFFSDPTYPGTAAGWWQAVTVGHPEFAVPTWEFFRRELIADVLFTGVFYALFRQSLKHPGTVSAADPVLAA